MPRDVQSTALNYSLSSYSYLLSNTTALKKFRKNLMFLALVLEDMLTPPPGTKPGIQLPCILNLNSGKTKERKDDRPGGKYEKGTPGPACDGVARRALHGNAIFRNGPAARIETSAQRSKIQ